MQIIQFMRSALILFMVAPGIRAAPTALPLSSLRSLPPSAPPPPSPSMPPSSSPSPPPASPQSQPPSVPSSPSPSQEQQALESRKEVVAGEGGGEGTGEGEGEGESKGEAGGREQVGEQIGALEHTTASSTGGPETSGSAEDEKSEVAVAVGKWKNDSQVEQEKEMGRSKDTMVENVKQYWPKTMYMKGLPSHVTYDFETEEDALTEDFREPRIFLTTQRTKMALWSTQRSTNFWERVGGEHVRPVENISMTVRNDLPPAYVEYMRAKVKAPRAPPGPAPPEIRRFFQMFGRGKREDRSTSAHAHNDNAGEARAASDDDDVDEAPSIAGEALQDETERERERERERKEEEEARVMRLVAALRPYVTALRFSPEAMRNATRLVLQALRAGPLRGRPAPLELSEALLSSPEMLRVGATVIQQLQTLFRVATRNALRDFMSQLPQTKRNGMCYSKLWMNLVLDQHKHIKKEDREAFKSIFNYIQPCESITEKVLPPV